VAPKSRGAELSQPWAIASKNHRSRVSSSRASPAPHLPIIPSGSRPSAKPIRSRATAAARSESTSTTSTDFTVASCSARATAVIENADFIARRYNAIFSGEPMMKGTSMNESLALTGSTGRLSGRVARQLAEAGVPLRLLVRDVARAPHLRRPPPPSRRSPMARRCDRRSPASRWSSWSPPPRLLIGSGHLTFVDAAAAAGVKHLVYTSFVSAAPDATFTLARDHHATEQHIRASGMRAWVSTYTAIAAGEMAKISPAVEQLTHRVPRSLREL
jgi:hypothetical protein